MAITKANLLSGAGRIFIADTDATIPDIFEGETDFGEDWHEVYTMDSVSLTYKPEFQEIKVNAHLASIKEVLVGEESMLGFTIAENDLFNFSNAIAASNYAATDSTAGSYTIVNVGDGDIAEKQIMFVGDGPEGTTRYYHFPICVCTGEFKRENQKEHTGVEVEFKVLADPNELKGARCYKIVDVLIEEV